MLLDFISDIFSDQNSYDFSYDDLNETSVSLDQNDFEEAIEKAPNINMEHLNELASNNDFDGISPHLKGLTGNLVAEKYFESLGANVEEEVWVDEGRIDLFVSSSDELELKTITLDEDKILLKNINAPDDFTIEIKTYSKDSFLFDKLDTISNQISDGKTLSGNNFLGVTEDFLELDPHEQFKIIQDIEKVGGSIVLLPYHSNSIDVLVGNYFSTY